MLTRGWRRAGGLLAALVIVSPLAACTSDEKPGGVAEVTEADAYNAAIRWYLGDVPTPASTDAEPLIVYVAPASGSAIDEQAQADVAREMSGMDDVVVVRFADVRDDALDVDIEGEPVKDDGVLLLVSSVDAGPAPLVMTVGVYRNAADQRHYRMQIIGSGETGQTFAATAVTEVAQG